MSSACSPRCGRAVLSGRASPSYRAPIQDRVRRACADDANPAVAGARGASCRLLHLDQVPDFVHHAAQLRTVFVLDRLVQTAEAERLHRPLLVGLLPDHAADVGDLQSRHAQPTGSSTGASATTGAATGSGFFPRRLRRSISSAGLPRAWATLSAVCSACKAAIVARTVLTGLFVPRDFVIMSLIPDNSTTARMAPPERIPVPGAAGLSSTLAAPFFKRISWGMVVPTIGTVMRGFFADSTALRMASGTSPALPRPAPTRPFWSPTTTRALNEKRRPPLTTFATRFRWTTFSVNSDWPLPYW